MTDPASLPRPITIAHRYGNSLEKLARAEDAGADVIELDVWLRNGRLEVRHEKTLGPIPLLYDKWKLEPAWKPRLQLPDVLAATRPGTGLMLDLKGSDAGLPAALLDAIAPYIDRNPMMVSARFWEHLPSLRVYPQLMLFRSVGTVAQLQAVRPLLDERENDAISIHFELLNAEVVRSLKQQVSIVATWPINDAVRLRAARSWPVDAIISDDLEILRLASDERSRD